MPLVPTPAILPSFYQLARVASQGSSLQLIS